MTNQKYTLKKTISLYIMAALYVAAGINHFRSPAFYYAIMPPYIPWPYSMIYISGAAEAALGMLLLPGKTRSMAAWGIVALLVAVFPANVQMLINYIQRHDPNIWVAIVRLPLQVPLIWWAWTFTKNKNTMLADPNMYSPPVRAGST